MENGVLAARIVGVDGKEDLGQSNKRLNLEEKNATDVLLKPGLATPTNAHVCNFLKYNADVKEIVHGIRRMPSNAKKFKAMQSNAKHGIAKQCEAMQSKGMPSNATRTNAKQCKASCTSTGIFKVLLLAVP